MNLNSTGQSDSIFWKVGHFDDRECEICCRPQTKYFYHPAIRSNSTISHDVLHALCLKCVEGIFSRSENEIFKCPTCRQIYPIKIEGIENKRLISKISPQYWVNPSSCEEVAEALGFLFKNKKFSILGNLLDFIKNNHAKTILKNDKVIEKVNSIAKKSGALGYRSIAKKMVGCCSRKSLGEFLIEAVKNNHKNCVLFLLKNNKNIIPNCFLQTASSLYVEKKDFWMNRHVHDELRRRRLRLYS